VVLVHGVLGFDRIRLGGNHHAYFRGIEQRLGQLESELHRPKVPPTAAVSVRAQRLADYVRELDARKVNLIAHSMGGIDARYAIAKLGLGRRVASLTTLGTPHHGTPLADVAARVLSSPFGLKRILRRLGLTVEGFFDLTTATMQRFNQEIGSLPTQLAKIACGCVLAVPTASRRQVSPLLLPTYGYLRRAAGPNDGIVPVSSQRWGDVLDTVGADHWALVGWSAKRFDVGDFYEWLLRELRGRGL
jgi:triacylglycerol lipase